MSKPRPVSYYRKRADKAMQEYYRGKENCEVCGGVYQCKHHFFTKGSSAYLRYDERNLISICNSCHFKHHNTDDANVHGTIMEQRGMEWYKELRRDQHKIQKVGIGYYKLIAERYEK